MFYLEISVIPELPAGKRVFFIYEEEPALRRSSEIELFIIPVWGRTRITLIRKDPAEPRSVCVRVESVPCICAEDRVHNDDL